MIGLKYAECDANPFSFYNFGALLFVSRVEIQIHKSLFPSCDKATNYYLAERL